MDLSETTTAEIDFVALAREVTFPHAKVTDVVTSEYRRLSRECKASLGAALRQSRRRARDQSHGACHAKVTLFFCFFFLFVFRNETPRERGDRGDALPSATSELETFSPLRTAAGRLGGLAKAAEKLSGLAML